MTPSLFESAAEVIRSSVDARLPAGPLEGSHLVEELERRVQRKVARRRWATACVGAALVIGGYSALHMRKAAELSYRVGPGSQLGVVGTYVSAPATQPLGLHFSEGSELVLQPKTRARVANTSSEGATIILENGRARADIVHRRNTSWRIFAGPYVVGVTGTSFEVGYDVSSQSFELNMKSGIVKVWGPGLVNPVEIRDTQRFVLSGAGAEAAREPSPVKEPTAEAAVVESPDVKNAPVASQEPVVEASVKVNHSGAIGARPTSVTSPQANVPLESWTKLSAKGQHRRILELAEQQGVDKVTATASGPDLLALGNSARFAGNPALAGKAYRALRARFSKSTEASSAAFFLARLSEASNPSQAIAWYDQYIAEAPTGAWVADAFGRRMVILNSTSGGASAQSTAKDYLKRFPNGPYAGFARVIVGQ